VIPPALLPLVDGHDLAAAAGHTFLLLTARDGGHPHAALLSAGEVLAVDGRLRLALWPGSTTTANLTATGRATLLAVLPPSTYHLRLDARRLPDLSVRGKPRACFEAEVVESRDDVVAYATVTSGVRFELVDREATLEAWQATLDAMRGETK
jgi:hypothetical protein